MEGREIFVQAEEADRHTSRKMPRHRMVRLASVTNVIGRCISTGGDKRVVIGSRMISWVEQIMV